MIVVSWGSWFNYVLNQLILIYMQTIGYFYVGPLLIYSFFPSFIYVYFMLWLLFIRIFFNGLLLGSFFPFFFPFFAMILTVSEVTVCCIVCE